MIITTGPPLALQLRTLQTHVELGADKNTTVVFPAPLMSTIAGLGTLLAREDASATQLPPDYTGPVTLSANGIPAVGGRP